MRISDLEGVKPGSSLEAAQELEDLLPMSLVVSAVLRYSKSLPKLKIDRATVETLLAQEMAQGRSQFAASHVVFKITRLRFARCVSDVLVEWSQEGTSINRVFEEFKLSGAEKSWIVLPARITGYFRDLYSGLQLTEESAFEAIAYGPFCKS